ncbi:CFEM domain-containing protein [Purpureocillium lavendulum]|uniref:CFEM domain-containing protein n=1 Tax=Purpureocillium lavendulum TaxID=1247861 RepID=A0AB34FPU1_9HYPO|nr:CFEM domain-containing protein [Purpureocillium lavendulum]
MKFLVPLALLAAAAVSAEDKTGGDSNSDCLADYIVTNCLASETKKASDCAAADWDCLCAAYEAIATCYNNCPKDPRAAPAKQQVGTYCANASLYGSKALASKTATGSPSSSTDAAAVSATATDSSDSTDIAPTKTAGGSSAAAATKTNAAEALNGNAGGVLVALFGAVAALL